MLAPEGNSRIVRVDVEAEDRSVLSRRHGPPIVEVQRGRLREGPTRGMQ